MAKKVDIGIFLRSRTVVDREETKRWLEFMGIEGYDLPPEEEISDAALNIGLSAKRCYMSFDTSKNPNLTRIRTEWDEYFENILKVGHGCYDAETEVLTSTGWRAWPDVTKKDLLATLTKDGTLTYMRPVAVESFDYSGKMYRVETQGVDLLVTPNHQMYVCVTTTREGRKRNDFSLIKAEELGTVSHAYTKIAEKWKPMETCGDSPNFCRFLGFAIGDGHYASGTTVRFRLRRQRKIMWLKRLVAELATEQPGQWGFREMGDDHYTVDIPAESYVKDTMSRMYLTDGDKCIPPHILMNCDREALEGLLEGLLQSDGHAGLTGDSFDTTSQILAGQIQQLCLHVGIAANVCYTYGPEERTSSYGEKPLTRLSILSRSLKPEVNKFAGQLGKTSWVEDWAGEVFCAQMPDTTQHVLYVRRNGQPVWCGNSVLEHSMFTFSIENVSRVFTGEMNRHRAGWAISEGSMRFIRFSDNVPYWEPTSIQGDEVLTLDGEAPFRYEELAKLADRVNNTRANKAIILRSVEEKKQASRAIFERMFDSDRDGYKVLEAIWKDELAPESKFKAKKEITSMMRRIVGMGCATGGTWTGNVRALRHVLALRCSPAAEEEILYVFSTIAKMMVEKEPLLFGDFHQTPEGYWLPLYNKV